MKNRQTSDPLVYTPGDTCNGNYNVQIHVKKLSFTVLGDSLEVINN